MEKYKDGKVIVDTSRPDLDDIVSEMWRRLGRYGRALSDFEAANENYLRARARAESGRLTRYGNPLGVRVSASSNGGGEDTLLDLVEAGKHVDDLRRGIALAYAATDSIIRQACCWNSRPGIALRETYLSEEPCVGPADLCRLHPDLFPTRSSAAHWTQKGINLVCYRIRDEHEDRDRCCCDM